MKKTVSVVISLITCLLPLIFGGCANYNNGISFLQTDRRAVVTFEPIVFSSAGHTVQSFGSQWGYPGFKEELDIRFTLNVPPDHRFTVGTGQTKVLDKKNGVLRIRQKIKVAPPAILDKEKGIDLCLRQLNSDIVLFYQGKVRGNAPDIDCCFLADGTALLEHDIELFAQMFPHAGQDEFIRAMRKKYDFDPGRQGNGRKDFCGNEPYYYLADGTPVYAYNVQTSFLLTGKTDDFFRHVRQMNRGKAGIIYKITPLVSERLGLTFTPPEQLPLITQTMPEFFEFRYLEDMRYHGFLWHNIPEKDAHKEMTQAEFEKHWQTAKKNKNYRYRAYSYKVKLPPVPEIVKIGGFVNVYPSVYYGRVLPVFCRMGNEETQFLANGFPLPFKETENFFRDHSTASAANFLYYISRKNRFAILPEFLWKNSDQLPYCRMNGELFCYRYLHLR